LRAVHHHSLQDPLFAKPLTAEEVNILELNSEGRTASLSAKSSKALSVSERSVWWWSIRDLVGVLYGDAQRAKHLAVDRHAVRVKVGGRDDQENALLLDTREHVFGQEHRPDYTYFGFELRPAGASGRGRC